MELVNFIFRLGVLFAIFGFIWWLINLGVSLLRGAQPKSLAETYIIKFVRYFFLVDVTIMFCLEDEALNLGRCIIAGLILLLYFLGKMQRSQLKSKFFNLQSNLFQGMQKTKVFSQKFEVIIISICCILFGVLLFFPTYAINPISEWFYETIMDFEEAPLLGFIFKIVGFFFVLSIFSKLFNGLTTLLSGGTIHANDPYEEEVRDDDDFDDYEEVN